MIEEADNGTLFLDEIGELTSTVQSKLLRVLEYGEFQRVGSTSARHSDVRVIAATNRDLEVEVSEGRFRSDLFHRIGVVTLHMPALRERMEDLEELVGWHLRRLSTELGRPEQELTEEVWKRMRGYDWPGNVREVRNVLERALVLSPDGTIRPEDIPAPGQAVEGEPEGTAPFAFSAGTPLVEALEAYKRWMVNRTLEECGGNQTKAAEMLGMHRSSLNRLLKELDLR
jgi:DNA-binding NtrC family response regulator